MVEGSDEYSTPQDEHGDLVTREFLFQRATREN